MSGESRLEAGSRVFRPGPLAPAALIDKFEVSGEVVMTDYGTLLQDHVTLRCRSIDRIFLKAYVPLDFKPLGMYARFSVGKRSIQFLLQPRLEGLAISM